jgi:hypothetical protein
MRRKVARTDFSPGYFFDQVRYTTRRSTNFLTFHTGRVLQACARIDGDGRVLDPVMHHRSFGAWVRRKVVSGAFRRTSVYFVRLAKVGIPAAHT